MLTFVKKDSSQINGTITEPEKISNFLETYEKVLRDKRPLNGLDEHVFSDLKKPELTSIILENIYNNFANDKYFIYKLDNGCIKYEALFIYDLIFLPEKDSLIVSLSDQPPYGISNEDELIIKIKRNVFDEKYILFTYKDDDFSCSVTDYKGTEKLNINYTETRNMFLYEISNILAERSEFTKETELDRYIDVLNVFDEL